MAGRKINVETLLAEMAAVPFLYNKKDKRYKDIHLKETYWTVIAERCHVKGDEIKKKWKNLVDTYRKEKKSIEEKCRNGAGSSSHYRKWKWFQQMNNLMHGTVGDDFSQTVSNLVVKEELPLVQVPSPPVSENDCSEEMTCNSMEDSTSSLSGSCSCEKERKRKSQDEDVHCLIGSTEGMVKRKKEGDEIYHYVISLGDRLRQLSPQLRIEARFQIEKIMYSVAKE